MKRDILMSGALLLSATVTVVAKNPQPNILLFLSDDHGFEQCEPYGGYDVETPNIAKLAEEGLVFDRAYIVSPASGPSRGALLSGLSSARNGAIVNHQNPNPESQIMVKQLQAAGYEVASFGKIADGKRQPSMCGFDYLDVNVNGGEVAASLERYLKDRNSDKPLCLMVGDRQPHVPWDSDGMYNADNVEVPSYLIDTPMTRDHWAGYLNDIVEMDSLLGEVTELCDEYLGSDDLLSIYSSDHGAQWAFGKWNLYERGVRTPLIASWKGHIHAGERTDAMVSWVDLLPTLIDIAGGEVPNDIDGYSFANVLINHKSEHRTEIYTTHTGAGVTNLYPIRAIRDEEFKYIRNLRSDCYHSNASDIDRKADSGAYWDEWDELAKRDAHAKDVISRYYVRPAEELYNLNEDPFESNNLADDPKYKVKLQELSEKLDRWMSDQRDVLVLPNEPYPLNGPTPHEILKSER